MFREGLSTSNPAGIWNPCQQHVMVAGQRAEADHIGGCARWDR